MLEKIALHIKKWLSSNSIHPIIKNHAHWEDLSSSEQAYILITKFGGISKAIVVCEKEIKEAQKAQSMEWPPKVSLPVTHYYFCFEENIKMVLYELQITQNSSHIE